MARMTKQDKAEWDDLYQYVKKEIMGYDDNQTLSRDQVLRLKGLQEGKYIANNKTQTMAHYSFLTIKYTFMACRKRITNCVTSMTFKDENHKFNTILKIVRESINDIYLRQQAQINEQKKIDNSDMSQIVHDKAEYSQKSTDMSDKQKKDLEQYW